MKKMFIDGEKLSLIHEAVNYIDAILYPIYFWQGTWSHVYGLSSNQVPTIFSAVHVCLSHKSWM
jgi:hypothetical protein